MKSAAKSYDESGVRVAVSGALGRMGSTTCAAVSGDPGLVLAALIDPGFEGVDDTADICGGTPDQPRRFTELEGALGAESIDVVVDFSTPSVVRANTLACIRHGVSAVVGTTGLGPGDLDELDAEARSKGVPVLIAPNFAMGAVLMMRFAELAAEHMRACEIVELHHEGKLDAPSGTSRLTRSRIQEAWREGGLQKEVPIHSIRLPGLVAHQEVIFGGLGETLSLRHDSLSRESFMPGVLLAVKRVGTLQGVVVGLENIL